MTSISIKNDFFVKLGYSGFDDYVDRRSNEILFDEVWVWRLRAGLEDDLSGLAHCEFLYIFRLVLDCIVKKGGIPVDYSDTFSNTVNLKQLLDQNDIDGILSRIVNFLEQDPEYGSDGNGIWFV